MSHEASRTGAPILLARTLRWFHDHHDVEIDTLLLTDGPLRPDFEAVGRVRVLDAGPLARNLSIAQRGLRQLEKERAWKALEAMRFGPAIRRVGPVDVVYLNTITSLEFLPHITGSPTVISHIHESDVAIRAWTRTELLANGRRRPDRWIAVSDDARLAVSALPGVANDEVHTEAPFIDVEWTRALASEPRHVGELRRSVGIPDGAFIVMGSGTIDWRKGSDLFVQLALEVRRLTDASVHFVWVGGDLESADWLKLEADLRRTAADHVHVVGQVDDPRPWFQAADVFALTSREDPFPLVCLEHAALRHPVVAYDSSGIGAFLRAAGPEAARGEIPYLDVARMAQRVIELLHDDDEREKVARQLDAEVAARHDIASAGPSLARIVGLPPSA